LINKDFPLKKTLRRVKKNFKHNFSIINKYGSNFIVTMKNGMPVLHSTDPNA